MIEYELCILIGSLDVSSCHMWILALCIDSREKGDIVLNINYTNLKLYMSYLLVFKRAF